MDQKKKKQPTATDLLRALVSSLPKGEFWTPEQHRAYRAAADYLAKQGK